MASTTFFASTTPRPNGVATTTPATRPPFTAAPQPITPNHISAPAFLASRRIHSAFALTYTPAPIAFTPRSSSSVKPHLFPYQYLPIMPIVLTPPSAYWYSSSSVLAPPRAAATVAGPPEVPPPTTTTSYSPMTGSSDAAHSTLASPRSNGRNPQRNSFVSSSAFAPARGALAAARAVPSISRASAAFATACPADSPSLAATDGASASARFAASLSAHAPARVTCLTEPVAQTGGTNHSLSAASSSPAVHVMSRARCSASANDAHERSFISCSNRHTQTFPLLSGRSLRSATDIPSAFGSSFETTVRSNATGPPANASNGTPAARAKDACSVQSTTCRALTAARPDLETSTAPATSPLASTSGPDGKSPVM